MSWTWIEGTSGIKGLVCVIPSSTLFMEYTGSVEFTRFVFLVYIFVSPRIFYDSSDGRMIVCLIGSGLFLLSPVYPDLCVGSVYRLLWDWHVVFFQFYVRI